MNPSATTPAGRLASLFPHERGPAEPVRAVAVGELREWPALWAADPRLLPAIGDAGVEAAVRERPDRLRYFSAADPAFPDIPLLRTSPLEGRRPCDPSDPRLPPGTGVRDKVWQRLVVEGTGLLPQPGFAAVDGDRVVACNAPWLVHMPAVDCRRVAADLRSAAVPGTVVVVEGVGVGLAAVAGDEGIRVVSRSPCIAAISGGAADRTLPTGRWPGFVADLCARPLPLSITKAAHNPAAVLGDALRACPGSYVLKPRYGSNGVAVVRLVSHPDGVSPPRATARARPSTWTSSRATPGCGVGIWSPPRPPTGPGSSTGRRPACRSGRPAGRFSKRRSGRTGPTGRCSSRGWWCSG